MTIVPPPVPQDQQQISDKKNLTLLSIFHFVGAGLALLGLGFLLLHFTIVRSVFSNPQFLQNQNMPMPPEKIFEMMSWFYFVFGLWALVSLALNLISGIFLLKRKARTFSMVVAVFNCLHIPLGTILGVFTLIILMRNSVRGLYDLQAKT